MQECATGRLSSVHHIIDLAGFEVSSAALQMVSGGALAYFMNLIHYEHYPALVTFTQFVNSSPWVATPYKVVLLTSDAVDEKASTARSRGHASRL